MYDSLGKYGILNAVATSNEIYDVDLFGDMPSTCPSKYLIATTNIDQKGQLRGAFGFKNIDLGAPGESTRTTLRNNNYGTIGGTSSASPQVAGAIALAYSVECNNIDDLSLNKPDSLALSIKKYILSTTKKTPSIEQNTVTGGLLNLNNLNNKVTLNCEDLILSLNSKILKREETKVFPNPFNETLTISLKENKQYKYLIFNLNNQLVKSGYTENKEQIIDLSMIQKGVYLLKIEKEKTTISIQKIIKI